MANTGNGSGRVAVNGDNSRRHDFRIVKTKRRGVFFSSGLADNVFRDGLRFIQKLSFVELFSMANLVDWFCRGVFRRDGFREMVFKIR